MKKLVLSLILMLTGLGFAYSQLPAPDTILITECYLGAHSGVAFMEITNMGKNPVNLERYFLLSSNPGGDLGVGAGGYYKLQGTLQPGVSYVIVGNYKRDWFETPELYDSVDWTPKYYRDFDYDLMTPNYVLNAADGKPGWNSFRPVNGTAAHGIGFDADADGVWNATLGDIVVDQVGLKTADGGGANIIPNVAGVTEAIRYHTLIRKFSVKLPNYGDFKSGQGVSSEDSEWIVIPFIPGRTSHFFKTLKRHSATDPWQVSSSQITIGEDQITVPWGIRRDSLYQAFDFGPNMAWHLKWGPDTLESVVAQTLDTLYMYLAGNEVTVKKFGVVQGPAPEGMNLAFPRYDRNSSNTLYLRYQVSDDFNPDTIYNIPFGTRVDTLYEYLEKSSGASWNIEFSDGIQRADLKTGDKLIVKAPNNATKDYYLYLNDYIPSNNAALGAIYIYGDTLYGFKSNQFNYTEMLSPGSDFPALSATPEDLNANVRIERPLSVYGGTEERTAKIYVTAEDDSTVNIYTVTFDFMDTQKEAFAAEPFFSQVINGVANLIPGATNTSGWGKGWEIFNPGNTVIPMGDYIIANGTGKTLESIVSSKDMLYTMRPGYTMDSTRIGVGIYYNERPYPFITDLEPGKTLVFGRGNYNLETGWVTTANAFFNLCDFRDTNGSTEAAYKAWGFVDGGRICFFGDGNSFYLVRINNDSIFNGLKSGGDPNDYTLVDIFGTQGAANNRLIEGVFVGSQTAKVLERKKHIWKGNPENHGSFGSEPGTGEWDLYQGAMYIGTHPYDPYTGYISTVYSLAYKVSPNYGPDETIGMVPPGTTVDDFLSRIVANGIDAEMTVTNADGSVVKTGTTQITEGDKLTVISGTKMNSTVYTISIQQPGNNALITSSVYTISASGENGEVSGIPAFTTIEDIVSNVTVPAGAKLNIIDVKDQQVGIEKVLFDTLVVVKTLASDSVKLEVVAEDGITRIVYNLVVTVEDPYVTSDFYLVLQDRKIIDMFQADTKVLTFLSRVIPSRGSSMKVLDKYGNEREMDGIMYKDDQLVVSDGTKTTTYNLKDMYDAFSTDATLSDLMIDGVTVAGFDPAVLTYTLVLVQGSAIPVVEATANYRSASMTIAQATNLEGTEAEKTAMVTVLAEDGETQMEYKIIFNLNVDNTSPEEEGLQIYSEGKTICIKTNAIANGDEVEVYNIAGQKIIHRKITTTFERLQVTQPSGIYLVKVKSEGKIHIEKILLSSVR